MFGGPPLTKEPTSFELKILLGFFLPILFLSMIFLFSGVTEKRKMCEELCLEKGFVNFRFIPEGRYGFPEATCHCLQGEDVDSKKARIKIDLN